MKGPRDDPGAPPPVVMYDDATARTFEPFALTRPACELVVGTSLITDRWELVFGPVRGFISAPHLEHFDEPDRPRMITTGTLEPGTIIANSRCALSLKTVDRRADVWLCDDKVAAVRLTSAIAAKELAEGTVDLQTLAGGRRSVEVSGRWINAVWDLIDGLNEQLSDDIPHLAHARGMHRRTDFTLTGEHRVFAAHDVTISPFVFFDTTAGPIYLGRGSSVAPFTRIAGPCFFDDHVTIVGDSIASCSIGPWSKVHGELSSSVIIGHSNKGHFGFVGHSYLGRWVNLGAGTTTSNLKNTYGPVSLWTPDGLTDTGLQFLGTMFGDHVKTGIGMRLNTGTVLGAGASVFDAMPPKMVEPFSWGSAAPYAKFEMDKFLEVAERMMARRKVPLSDRARRQLAAAYGRSGR